MTDAPGRPFWKRKRWIAAAILWLAIAYPLSLGPVTYAVLTGWIHGDTYTAYRVPWDSVTPYSPDRLLSLFGNYLEAWIGMAGPEVWDNVRNRR